VVDEAPHKRLNVAPMPALCEVNGEWSNKTIRVKANVEEFIEVALKRCEGPGLQDERFAREKKQHVASSVSLNPILLSFVPNANRPRVDADLANGQRLASRVEDFN